MVWSFGEWFGVLANRYSMVRAFGVCCVNRFSTVTTFGESLLNN